MLDPDPSTADGSEPQPGGLSRNPGPELLNDRALRRLEPIPFRGGQPLEQARDVGLQHVATRPFRPLRLGCLELALRLRQRRLALQSDPEGVPVRFAHGGPGPLHRTERDLDARVRSCDLPVLLQQIS